MRRCMKKLSRKTKIVRVMILLIITIIIGVLAFAGKRFLATDNSYQVIDETGNYLIVKPNYGEYKVTQLASVTGEQAMIYIISDWRGHLIIVDGGWSADAEQLQEIITAFGNKVDVWILTHPHPDHIGAFNEIYEKGAIEIDSIYAIPMDYSMYKERAQWWDGFEVYERFLDLTSSAENVEYVIEGDQIDLFGLNMKILHSFNEDEMKSDGDICNNGGMIFKLSAKENSMLFLADVGGEARASTLLDKYGDELESDYVQMGHHGNGGMTEEVYRVINPKVAFFDAPQSLMDNEELDAVRKQTLMEDIGADILYYSTAPNSVILK